MSSEKNKAHSLEGYFSAFKTPALLKIAVAGAILNWAKQWTSTEACTDRFDSYLEAVRRQQYVRARQFLDEVARVALVVVDDLREGPSDVPQPLPKLIRYLQTEDWLSTARWDRADVEG